MTSQGPTLIALGNFDGIHRGHRRVIDPILRSPLMSSSAPTTSTASTAVVSFIPHPQEFFTGQPRSLLAPLAERRAYLYSIGVDDLILLNFDAQMAALSPQKFIDNILVEQLNTKYISVGQNFRFGHRRAGTAKDLQQMAAARGIPVHITPLHLCGGDRISSSAIRHALTTGDVDTANRLLGRPYCLIGTVIHGQKLGRTIGFPTANLALPDDKFLPSCGVYAVHVGLTNPIKAGKDATGFWEGGKLPLSALPPYPSLFPGVMNIGYRPTVAGIQQIAEVHLLDWSGDLYDKIIAVQLRKFLRPEQKFDGLDALKGQIAKDCDRARSFL
ncbi:MAG: bifunctional riboflavin kinase/FAD synthetase [Cyanothece sp. SIO2G6]|nr:bifunctional riboflavin kinase/FAD synthetase [Cyanothece sp. SIO2G6]